MYALILMATLTIAQDGYHAVGTGGGVNVEVEKFDTLEQCEKVKSVFMNDMSVTNKELMSGRTNIATTKSKIYRQAKCVKL